MQAMQMAAAISYLVHVRHKILQLLQPLAYPRSSFLNKKKEGLNSDQFPAYGWRRFFFSFVLAEL
jgi:hypothetical protein